MIYMNEDEEAIEADTSALYETRLIILIETNPQSNVYRQLILDPKQFKRVSHCLFDQFSDKKLNVLVDLREGQDVFEVKLSNDTYGLHNHEIRSYVE